MSAAETFESNVHDLVDRHDPMLAQFARFRDRFAEAMDESLHTIDDLEERIALRKAILFAGKDAAVVAEIVDYAGGAKAMQILWACGDLDEIVALAPGIESTARVAGCTTMIVEGQRAWERVLKGLGYTFFSVTLSKEL